MATERAAIAEAYGEAYAVQQLGPGPDECAEEAMPMANVMIAGGNPDVYHKLMLTTTSDRGVRRHSRLGPACAARRRRLHPTPGRPALAGVGRQTSQRA